MPVFLAGIMTLGLIDIHSVQQNMCIHEYIYIYVYGLSVIYVCVCIYLHIVLNDY